MHELLRGATWRKSIRSGGGNNCVEMTRVPSVVAVRDSKAPEAGAIALLPEQWAAVAAEIKAGRHDL